MLELLNLSETLTNYIIRPPRAVYSLRQLGHKQFEQNTKIFERTDFEVKPTTFVSKDYPHKIKASIFQQKYSVVSRPIIIYLHGNSSCRISGVNYLMNALNNGFDFVCYDYRGAGISDGAYLTLGYLEKEDLLDVINTIDNKFGVREYILWGRSMGAVTALLFAAKYRGRVQALVTDSPFGDLEIVINELVEKKTSMIPEFVISQAVKSIQKIAKEKIQKEYGQKLDYQITKLKPIQVISKVNAPIFFIGSKSDQLVSVKQIYQYYELANVYKQMQILEGGHNETRPEHLKQTVTDFLKAVLRMKKQKKEGIKKPRLFSFPQRSPEKQRTAKSKTKQKEKQMQRSKSKQKVRYNRKLLWEKIEIAAQKERSKSKQKVRAKKPQKK